ncbi:interleukin 2 receptor, gamma b [Engraulis encrasicolus]|uniref:interleukin 2 receptor, gamma b n=1 Tax=Engraulis encrasicolus TaxID=184585 RepID=UPI002FD080CD
MCRAGCIFPMETPHLRFSPLSTTLSNGSTQRTQTHELKNAVKLNPPQNVTVQWSNSTGDVRLLWALGKPIKEQCVETHFSFRRGEGPWQDPYPISNNYQFPVSQTRRYQFRVRHRYNNNCGESYWSDWSETVPWGPIKPPQEPGNSEKSKQAKDLRGLYVAIGLVAVFIILAVLTRLLLDCERIKVILVPVGPDPAKKLNDLFLEYSGNVEGWVRISPQLRDAFDPDYTESTCEVTGDDPTGCVVDELPQSPVSSQSNHSQYQKYSA